MKRRHVVIVTEGQISVSETSLDASIGVIVVFSGVFELIARRRPSFPDAIVCRIHLRRFQSET